MKNGLHFGHHLLAYGKLLEIRIDISVCLARKIIIPAFTLMDISIAGPQNSSKHSTSYINSQHLKYCFKPYSPSSPIKADLPLYSYNFFPLVVIGDGSVWKEANLYILARLEGSISPSMSTYSAVADDLVAFRNFIESNQIDFTKFPKSKLFRPTYLYRGELQSSVSLKKLSPTTARRRMGTVINFYRWLISEKILNLDNPPWIESDSYIKVSNSAGFSFAKALKITDISMKISKQHDPYDGSINDGGKLQPLNKEEQIFILEALIELNNIEMTLIHFVALLTGARIQTILTLRIGNFKLTFSKDINEVRIKAGYGTMVDTKNDKQLTIFFPLWLYEILQLYAASEHSKSRRNKSDDKGEFQYLFLSNRGVSFYKAKNEKINFDELNTVHHEKNGQTVRQYISEKVIPLVSKKMGKSFRYKFHDLRATYGMNLTDQQLSLVEMKKITLSQGREFVKTRMGHQSAATTDLYLTFRRNLSLAANTQSDYEGHLKALANTIRSKSL